MALSLSAHSIINASTHFLYAVESRSLSDIRSVHRTDQLLTYTEITIPSPTHLSPIVYCERHRTSSYAMLAAELESMYGHILVRVCRHDSVSDISPNTSLPLKQDSSVGMRR